MPILPVGSALAKFLRHPGIVLLVVLALAGGSSVHQAQAQPYGTSEGVPPQSSVVRVGAGGYLTSLPPGRREPPSAVYRLDTLSGPVPTNTWWSSALFKPLSDPLYAHPLVFRATQQGLGLGYPPVRVRGGSNPAFFADYREDLILSLNGLQVNEAWVAGYSDWTVDLQFQNAGLRLTARIGHGFPYAYATFEGADPVVIAPARYTVWFESSDGRTLGISVNGAHYGLFCPAGGVWEPQGPFRLICRGAEQAGYVSVGLVPAADPELLERLRRHAFVFPESTRVAWSYDQATGAVRTEFAVTVDRREGDEGEVLLALYPHQWKHTDLQPLAGWEYISPRGPLKVIQANRFQTVHTYGGILPYLPPLPETDAAALNVLLDQSLRRPLWPRGLGTGEHDTYWTGKSLNRAAQLIPIAAQLGRAADQAYLLEELRARLEAWLTADGPHDPHVFYYNARWGTLIGYPASHGTDEHLNDHHFHYGYFIAAAAMAGLYDKDWLRDDRWGGMIQLLVRDWAAWDREDPLFPFLRTFDPYAGHSWASGRGDMREGNNQESSSEAIHAWSGLILLGEVTGNRALRDLGVWGYTLETHAARYYWFDVTEELFPNGYGPPVIGRLFGSGGDYDTWWTHDPAAVHAINVLPVTGASLYLGADAEHVRRTCAWLRDALGGRSGGWADILASYCALADPEAALRMWQEDPGPEFGDSPAHTYHWIRSLHHLGRVVAGVTANHALYAVFEKDGVRTYVAYNATDAPIQVVFSDGTAMVVEANSMGVHRAVPGRQENADPDGQGASTTF